MPALLPCGRALEAYLRAVTCTREQCPASIEIISLAAFRYRDEPAAPSIDISPTTIF